MNTTEEQHYQQTVGETVGKRARARVIVERREGDSVFVLDEEQPSGEVLEVACNVTGVNAEFRATVESLWEGCRLNLLDVAVTGDGRLVPGLVILEPDFLLDISALAECVKEYGTHPLYYLKDAFRHGENRAPLLLGNAVNLFFDEICRERDVPVDDDECMERIFRAAPLDFATCEGIDGAFFQEMKTQFRNLRRVAGGELQARGIYRERGLIEPAFICERLGIQGRLDFLQADPPVVIELKSGNAPYPASNHAAVKPNHRVQALLYQIVMQEALGLPFDKLSTYILYSRYTAPGSNLRPVPPVMAEIREILDVRNRIVAAEREIAMDGTGAASRVYLDRVRPAELITDWSSRRFIERYIVPSIDEFRRPLTGASALEREYFHAFHAFVARERFLARVGCPGDEACRGVAAAWRDSLDEKQERGEILVDLEIARDDSTRAAAPSLTLRVPPRDEERCPPNFREGDVVMFYERNAATDNVTTRQVFRGSIERLSPGEIVIRPRAAQRAPSPFRRQSRYAVEHDAFDSSGSACRGLYLFLQANKERRDLLLDQRAPSVDTSRVLTRHHGNAGIDDLVLKAKQAADYFILVGPPGTGKTSIALKAMVEEFRADNLDVLLLSYTNRAVDEICETLEQLDGRPPYVRVGPELPCAAAYRHRLLEKIIAPCKKRKEIRDAIDAHHLFVATTTAIAGKTTLFLLKHFHVAIIDEASQILEPQVIGILSAKDHQGNNAIDKFILVGDHKQLPAIVMQSRQESAAPGELPARAGVIDRRDSLFERLHRLYKHDPRVVASLDKQGRMHPEISRFPAREFYGDRLTIVPVPHQQEGPPVDFPRRDDGNPLERLVATRRLLFFPSRADTGKQNRDEAAIVAAVVAAYRALCGKNHLRVVPHAGGEGETSIGVITPYRNQIALIRQEINKTGDADDVTIDTVERFQGSQRDMIIYSCCVNDPRQLELLSNTVEEEGIVIDRKLNVAITRARKQLFITGNPGILSRSPVHARLIAFIREQGGFIEPFFLQ
ncbi:MAG: AAA family ATPase [Odoribacteraceae bacterium]|nr:AAA family ATPase [Odoribacteraceae bacterium]